MKKFYLISLGCPKNLVDSETIASKLTKSGYELTLEEKEASIVVINTCAFLSSAIEESEAVIERYIELKKKKNIEIVVCGCLVERLKDKLLKKYTDIDFLFGIDSIDEISKISEKSKKIFLKPHPEMLNSNDRILLTSPHVAYLKIADGCNNFCSYCTIPKIRGRFRSKPVEYVVEEAKNLSDVGVKELCLIAQDTTSYGVDIYGKPFLTELLKEIEKIKNIKWIRLMYLYPRRIDKKLLIQIKNSKKILRYLEMPVQHISDKILKKMNRKYNKEIIEEKLQLIKSILPDVALRTTVITGFPGETDDDFNELLNFINKYKFNSLSAFKYSREKDTAAYSMKQIDEKTKEIRYKKIIKAQSMVVDDLNLNMIGKRFKVIFDTKNTARSYFDAPDIDGYFSIINNHNYEPGDFANVKVLKAKGYERKAMVVSKSV